MALVCAAPAMPAEPPGAPLTPSRAVAPSPAPVPVPDNDPVDPAPAPRGARDPSPPPSSPAPAPVPDEAVRVAVRVDAVAPDAAVRAGEVAGVAHATTVRVGRLVVGAGPDEMTVAAVDPAMYRPFAPQVVADTAGVWDRLAEGELAVTHEHAARLGLELGGPVVLGAADGVTLRVGALASNGLPPVAQAIVGHQAGAGLGLAAVAPTLLVAVTADADPAEVAARLGERLGRSTTVVPDPRVPATVIPAPPQGDTVWDVLAACESSGDWRANTGNGFYGGLQFLPESWWLVGGRGMPHEASREEQILRAERLLAIQGWAAWPVCSVRVGLRPDPNPGAAAPSAGP